ncbi:MAG: hypothetical protein CM15mP123_03810 [Gammaproteobacteria bacterium]|nr:MAG: hypothetical protein CM15mP123_03810 [Gammaproteobacteria bacterium]
MGYHREKRSRFHVRYHNRTFFGLYELGYLGNGHADIEQRSGTTKEAAAVHMGTWYAGDLLDASDWPVERTASLAGMAMFDYLLVLKRVASPILIIGPKGQQPQVQYNFIQTVAMMLRLQ